jgi:hypothetical protein
MGPIGCIETLLNNYQPTLRLNLEALRYLLARRHMLQRSRLRYEYSNVGRYKQAVYFRLVMHAGVINISKCSLTENLANVKLRQLQCGYRGKKSPLIYEVNVKIIMN